jgi:hypothetical protein
MNIRALFFGALGAAIFGGGVLVAQPGPGNVFAPFLSILGNDPSLNFNAARPDGLSNAYSLIHDESARTLSAHSYGLEQDIELVRLHSNNVNTTPIDTVTFFPSRMGAELVHSFDQGETLTRVENDYSIVSTQGTLFLSGEELSLSANVGDLFLDAPNGVVTTTSAVFVDDLTVSGTCTGCGGGGGLTQSSDTFELTWEASCTADVTQTWSYVLTGDLVTLTMVDALSCTADVTTFASDADMPMAIRPARTINFGTGLGAIDNNVLLDTIAVCLRINASGSVNIIRGASGDLACAGSGTAGWTASGTRGVIDGSSSGWNTFSYSIN